mgnify:CR=1 FL=1
MPVANAVAAMAEELAAWRRDFHRYPELMYAETRTAARVTELLRSFGLDVVETGLGGTGVVGVLHGARGPGAGEAETILLRADMDGLPIVEATGAAHASCNPGVMHACGHDGHTTMLLGAAKRLAETRAFDGTVVFCFQPAEEGGGGAQAMLDDGLLERFPARAVYGMHNWPGMPVGSFAVRAGPTMAMADEFFIDIAGRGGHAAKPELARDPIVAGAALVQALHTIVSRQVDANEAAVLSITRFNGGSATNVIPEQVELAGTVRAFSEATHGAISKAIERKCAQFGAAFGVSISYRQGESVYPPVHNDPDEAAFCGRVLDALVGRDRVTHDHPPVMGSEDFAFLAKARPGAFVFIGSGDIAPLHHPEYDFDDAVSPWGVTYWVQLVEAALPRPA